MKHVEKRFDGLLAGRGPKSAWVFLEIPFDVREVFGSKARVAVRGTLNGLSFQNSLLPNGDGTHSMAVNKTLLAGAKAKAGDTVAVVMAIDAEARSVAIPEDFGALLKRSAKAKRAFDALSYSRKKEFVDWILGAKRPETRARRLEKTMQMVAEGMRLTD